MKQTPTTWIDLTDLAAWSGHFSGIQRVVYEYAEKYYAEGARFFVFHPVTQRFTEVSGEQYFAEHTPGSARTRDKIKRIYRFVVPKPLRRITTPLGRSTLHQGRKGLAKVFRAVGRTDHLFGAGDTVLLFGAPWESVGMIQELAARKAQLGLRLVHVLHDVLPLSQPHLFDEKLVRRFTKHMETALPICDGLVCVSKATQADAADFAARRKLSLTDRQLVVRLGEDTFTSFTPKQPSATKKLTSDFIFCLGTIEIRKNHQLLYQAYKLAQAKGIELPALVIAGRKGWLSQDFLYVLNHDASLKDKIIVLNSASDAEVQWLYNRCLFAVYPPLCEGWGLSIADALGKGKLCLTSNTSSMPEVAGPLDDYFSPYDSHECMELIHHYYTDREALQKKEAKIKAYKPHTWQQSYAAVKAFTDALELVYSDVEVHARVVEPRKAF